MFGQIKCFYFLQLHSDSIVPIDGAANCNEIELVSNWLRDMCAGDEQSGAKTHIFHSPMSSTFSVLM